MTQLTLGELAEISSNTARIFHTTENVKVFLQENKGKPIDESLVVSMLRPLANMIDDACNSNIASIKLEQMKKEIITSVQRNDHMNNISKKESVLLDQDWIDAIIVAFVNELCIPLDLAMYTSDLYDR